MGALIHTHDMPNRSPILIQPWGHSCSVTENYLGTELLQSRTTYHTTNVNLLRMTESPLKTREGSKKSLSRYMGRMCLPQEHLADKSVLVDGLFVFTFRDLSPHL